MKELMPLIEELQVTRCTFTTQPCFTSKAAKSRGCEAVQRAELVSEELVLKQFVTQSKLDIPKRRKREASESEPEPAEVIDVFTASFQMAIVKYLKHS